MKFRLEMECDNDAFGADPRDETARILREIATRLEKRQSTLLALNGALDVNGNSVCSYYFKED